MQNETVLNAFEVINLQENNISSSEFIGALALGAQRLLPSIQQIFASWTSIRTNTEGINNIIDIIKENIAE